MTKFYEFILRYICKRIVTQGHYHPYNIKKYYQIMRDAAKNEFWEDNAPTLEDFLFECWNENNECIGGYTPSKINVQTPSQNAFQDNNSKTPLKKNKHKQNTTKFMKKVQFNNGLNVSSIDELKELIIKNKHSILVATKKNSLAEPCFVSVAKGDIEVYYNHYGSAISCAWDFENFFKEYSLAFVSNQEIINSK